MTDMSFNRDIQTIFTRFERKNYLIFALALQIEVESHHANQFISLLKYWYIMEYNYLQRNNKLEILNRDLYSPLTFLCLWQMCNDRDFLYSQKNHHSFLRISHIWNLLFCIYLSKEQWLLHLYSLVELTVEYVKMTLTWRLQPDDSC